MSDIKKVVVIGPECTGKSDLSAFLADRFNTVWVPEYARAYLDNLSRPYEEHDLLTIAQGQMRSEDQSRHLAHDVMICDTNLYVLKVWSEFKFGRCHPEILANIASRPYDLYLLTYVDIPWQEDPQREHPDKRQQLYEIYHHEMMRQSVPFVEIRGPRDQRRKSAVEAIEKIVCQIIYSEFGPPFKSCINR